MNDTENGRDLFVIDIDGQQTDPLTPRSPELQKKLDILRQKLIGRIGPNQVSATNSPPAGQPTEVKDF